MPVIVSDVRISVDGIDDWHFTPNIIGNEQPHIRLARKSYILNDSVAIAVAGCENTVRDFLEYADASVGNSSNPAALQTLKSRAQQYAPENLSMIAIFAEGSSAQPRYVAYGRQISEEFFLRDFGSVMAIGSGSKDIQALLTKAKLNIDPMKPGDIFLNHHLAHQVCSSIIFEETYSKSSFFPQIENHMEDFLNTYITTLSQ